MKKSLLFTALCIVCAVLSTAQVKDLYEGFNPMPNAPEATAASSESEEHVIVVETPGTLSSLISEEERLEWDNLTISGPINGDDLAVIRYMSGRDKENKITDGKLAKLDMQNANIVKGGYFYNTMPQQDDNVLWNEVFEACNSLKEVVLPKSLVRLTGMAFYNCKNLQKVILNDMLQEIGNDVFYDCKALVEIDIPASVQSIGWDAFQGCTKLFTINIPEDSQLNTLGNYAFEGCTALKSIFLPEGLESIPQQAFYRCYSLESVSFPKNTKVRVIGEDAFGDCFNLKEMTIPSTVYELERWSFINCENLTTVNISEDSKLSEIGENAFAGTQLHSFYIPQYINNINGIGISKLEIHSFSVHEKNNTYSDIDGILYNKDQTNLLIVPSKYEGIVSLPSTVTNIEPYAFWECKSIDAIVSSALVPPSIQLDDLSTLAANPIFLVKVPAEALEAYRTAEAWNSIYQQIVPSDVSLDITAEVKAQNNTSGLLRAVGERELSYATHLTLSGSINSYDFMIIRNKMPNLHYLDLTETTIVANPYEYVAGCHSEDNRIGDDTFSKLSKLIEVKLPNSITYLGKSAFFGCHNLRSVTLHPGLTTIDDNAFDACSSLEKIEIPSSVNKIGVFAFYDCNNLKDAIINEGLLTLGAFSFASCSSLRSVSLPESLKEIDQKTFSGCSSLEKVTIPSRVYQIDEYAFWQCTQLKELRIPPMLEQIGTDAFRGCDALKDIYVYLANAKDIKIDQNTFSCWNTAELHVPDFASDSYYWDTQWSQFAKISEFSEPYETFYTNNTMTLDEGTGTIDGNPEATMHENGGLIVEDVTQTLSDVELRHDGTDGASLIATGDGLIQAENLKIKINVKGYQWHFFSFPFNISLEDISYEGDYVWRQYDGAARSRREGGWQNLAAGTTMLEKGRGYIFQGTNTGELVLSVVKPELSGEDITSAVEEYQSESAQDAGWNFVGNPYTSYYEVTEETYSAPITVWTGTRYEAYRPGDDDYCFAPYQAFFVQANEEDVNGVEFSKDQRLSYTESKQVMAQARARRARKKANPSRLLIDLELMAQDDSLCIDKSRVVFNNRRSTEYEAICDAAKFSSDASKAELYTLDGDGTCYAINERPVEQGVVPVGVKVNEPGVYTINAPRQDNAVSLIDYKTGITHDLSLGGYEFTADKGDYTNRFAIKLNKEETSIESIMQKTGVQVSTEGGITVGNVADDVDVSIYNLAGVCLVNQQGGGSIELPAGTYILNIGITAAKVVVK